MNGENITLLREHAKVIAKLSALPLNERIIDGGRISKECRDFQSAIADIRSDAAAELHDRRGLTWEEVGNLVGLTLASAQHLAAGKAERARRADTDRARNRVAPPVVA